MKSLNHVESNLPQVNLLPGIRYKFHYKNTTQIAIVQILTGPNGRSNFVRVLDITNRKTRIIDLDRIAKIQICIERSNIIPISDSF